MYSYYMYSHSITDTYTLFIYRQMQYPYNEIFMLVTVKTICYFTSNANKHKFFDKKIKTKTKKRSKKKEKGKRKIKRKSNRPDIYFLNTFKRKFCQKKRGQGGGFKEIRKILFHVFLTINNLSYRRPSRHGHPSVESGKKKEKEKKYKKGKKKKARSYENGQKRVKRRERNIAECGKTARRWSDG